jgi:hypothetical protein
MDNTTPSNIEFNVEDVDQMMDLQKQELLSNDSGESNANTFSEDDEEMEEEAEEVQEKFEYELYGTEEELYVEPTTQKMEVIEPQSQDPNDVKV